MLAGIASHEQLPPDAETACTPGHPRGQRNWDVAGTHSGRVLCYASGDKLWIVWSYDADKIVASAVRSGTTDEDWTSLYDWWSQIRLFLR